MTPEQRLADHVARFNDCVATREFGPYVELFTADGCLKLLGVEPEATACLYEGREQIAVACHGPFTEDALEVMNVIAAKPAMATFDYGRAAAPKDVAGQIIIKWADDGVTSMTVTRQ